MAPSGSGKALAAQTVHDLDNLLQVVGNSVTITSGTLSNDLFSEVLSAFNSSKPLQLLNVAKQVKSDGVTITGTASFLGERGVTTTAIFMPNGDFSLLVDLPATDLAALLEPANALKLPKKFNVPLPETWGIAQRSGGELTFLAAAKGNVGQVLVNASKASSGWNAVAGLDLKVKKLADLPALKSIGLATFDDFVGLSDIMMVLSTQDLSTFDFPDVSQFNAPALGRGKIKLPDQASGLVKGMNIYARLSTTDSKAFRLLAKYLKLKLDGSLGVTLSVSLPNPEKNSKLFVSIKETITSGIVVDGMIGGILQDGLVGAFMAGTARVSIQRQPVLFSVQVVVLETGVVIEGSMQNKIPIQFKIEGVLFQISNLALLLGIDDEGIPSLGFAASLTIGKLNGSVALLLDSTDPAKSMFAGSISDISLCDVAETIAGQKNVPNDLRAALKKIGVKGRQSFTVPKSSAGPLIKALNDRDLKTVSKFFHERGSIALPTSSDDVLLEIAKPNSTWYLTDLAQPMHYEATADRDGAVAVALEPQIYCVPQDTQLGTLHFSQGFKLIGELDLFIVNARVSIDIKGLTGACADVTVNKITIGNTNFFALTSADGRSGPQVSISTFTQSAQAQPDKTLRPPHICITGDLVLLGVDLSRTYLSVSEKGVVVDIGRQVSPVVRLSVNGTIGDPKNMKLGGSVALGVDANLNLGKLGKLHFKEQVSGALTLGVTNGKPLAGIAATIDFAGLHLKTPKLELDVNTKALANLAGTLAPEIASAIVKALSGSAELWLKLVKSGIIAGLEEVKKVGKLLETEFNLTATAASKLLKGAGYGVNEIASVLNSVYGLSAKEASRVLTSALGIGSGAVAGVLKAGGYAAKDISDALGSVVSAIGKTGGKAVNEVGRAGGKAVNEVGKAGGKAVKQVGKTGGRAVNQVGKAGGKAVNEVGKAGGKAVKQVGKIGKLIGI